MQLRVARHTQRLDELVAFYRDGIGLPEIGGFRDHRGYDGAFLAVPGTEAHLEFTTGGDHGAPAPNPESLLVLYLGDRAAVDAVAARLSVPASPRPTRIGPITDSRSRIPTASGSSSWRLRRPAAAETPLAPPTRFRPRGDTAPAAGRGGG